MQAGEAGFAERVQPGHVGAPVAVDDHAAAGVVRRRHHRNRIAGDVQPQLQALGVHGGEVLDDEIRRLVADVQIQAVRAQTLHFMVYGARHHVPGGQLGALVEARHEALAVGQQQAAALAANRLGDQKALRLGVVQAGGVELHEFHVRHPAAGAPRHGDAVAGGHVRVGGIQVHLGGAAGGQHHRTRQNHVGFAGFDVVHIGPAATTFFTLLPVGAVVLLQNQVHGDPVLKKLYIVALLDAVDQRAGDRHPGGVGGVDDAPVAVAALAGQVVGQGIGLGALQAGKVHPLVDQPADRARPVFHRVAHRVVMAQAAAGQVGVAHVALQGVVAVEHRGHAALGVVSACMGEFTLGQQRRLHAVGQAQGHGKAGGAGADDQNVVAEGGHEASLAGEMLNQCENRCFRRR